MKKLHTKYKDWFINLEKDNRIPPIGTKEYDDLVDQEVQRCMLGVYVDGVYFHGWYYWHINHWWIRIDIEDENGVEIREELHPDIREY